MQLYMRGNQEKMQLHLMDKLNHVLNGVKEMMLSMKFLQKKVMHLLKIGTETKIATNDQGN